MSSVLRTKVFEGHIMPRVQRLIAYNPLRRHDQTLDFRRWWQIIMGYPLADASTSETEPDYRIVEEAGGRRVLKRSGFNSRLLDFTTYKWTSQEHASTKSYIETVARIRKGVKTHMATSRRLIGTGRDPQLGFGRPRAWVDPWETSLVWEASHLPVSTASKEKR